MQAMLTKLMSQLKNAPTAYHAAAVAARELDARGYTRLEAADAWDIQNGGKYYVTRNGSALIAFVIGKKKGAFRIVASHLDSPAFAVKGNPVTTVGGVQKLNVERYGGALNYTWLDTPLYLAGRVVRFDEKTNALSTELVLDTHKYLIPSLAIHFNREANSSLALNAQIDMQPIFGLGENAWPPASFGENIVESELFLVSATEPYLAGAKDELLVSPRIDNLTSAFGSLEALEGAGDTGVSVAFLADNEEVGSRTKQGAGSDFLASVLRRIAAALSMDLDRALASSFLVSCDNAHAIHPNHPEKSDPTNHVLLGGGVVIKHHANQNYTTDAVSAAVFKSILKKENLPYQDFYMRADMPCGSTLGAISSLQVSVRSVDIGLAQLSMHASVESMAVSDYRALIRALSAFYSSSLEEKKDGEISLA